MFTSSIYFTFSFSVFRKLYIIVPYKSNIRGKSPHSPLCSHQLSFSLNWKKYNRPRATHAQYLWELE